MWPSSSPGRVSGRLAARPGTNGTHGGFINKRESENRRARQPPDRPLYHPLSLSVSLIILLRISIYAESMDQAALFLVFAICSVLNAIYWSLSAMDSVGWIRGVMGYSLAFIGCVALKFLVMYLFQEALYPSLSFFFWTIYFLEHFVESILWNCLGSIVRVRYGKRIDYRKDVIDAIIRLCIIMGGFCFVMILTILFAHDPERSVAVLRQISLMLTICSAIAEYTTVVVYGSLLRDSRMILSNRAMILVMAPPCLTLASSLAVCGLPEVSEGTDCVAFELVHLSTLTGTVAALWYYALLCNTGRVAGAAASRTGDVVDTAPSYQLTIAARPGWTAPVPVRL